MNDNARSREKVSVIVVARHGERLDFFVRDNPDVASGQTNWVASASQPFDPPLTIRGHDQALKLGNQLVAELKKLELPQISEIYSSPLLRCRETAYYAPSGLVSDESTVPVRVEPGLVESINEQWYRSWALPGSDGTWGFRIDNENGYDSELIHPLAKQPVQSLLDEWKTDARLDHAYTPKTFVLEPYCFHPSLFETNLRQRNRMKEVVASVCQPGKTVLLVSHGGPVTHLYAELTGNSWTLHGKSKYCCCSIYKKDDACGDDAWIPVDVNQSQFLDDREEMHEHQYINEEDP
jgi:broad specificity phosphatase PhoE